MLQISPCDLENPGEGCCEALWDQGVLLINAAGTALGECLQTQTCCDRAMRGYVSLGPPAVWQSDILVSYLEAPGFTYSPKTYDATGVFAGPPQMRAMWRVYLIESGYPGLQQDAANFYVPDDDELHHANRHIYAHGEAIMRGLVGSTELRRCSGFTMRDMTFVGPTAGPEEEGVTAWHAGWSIGVQLDLRF